MKLDPVLYEFATDAQRKHLHAIEEHGGYRPAARALELSESSMRGTVERVTRRMRKGVAPPKGAPGSGQPPTQESATYDTDNNTITVVQVGSPVTEDDALKMFDVDTTRWKVSRMHHNVWNSVIKAEFDTQYSYDEDGRKDKVEKRVRPERVNLYQTKLYLEPVAPLSLLDGIELFIAAKKLKAAPVVKKPKRKRERLMAVVGLWDAHLGSFAWHDETGEDWDLKIAERRLLNAIDDIAVKLEPKRPERILMPIGNDFYHLDNASGVTEKHGNRLDTDTRWAKIYDVGIRVQTRIIELMLEISGEVEILHIPGNHDKISSWWLGKVLEAHFRRNERLTFDVRPMPRKYHLWEHVLIGFDHGVIKPNRLLGSAPYEVPEEVWAQSRYRELHLGDKHHREDTSLVKTTVNEHQILARINPSLCGTDSYHFSNAWSAMKMAQAWRYTPTGYDGSEVAWARDDKR